MSEQPLRREVWVCPRCPEVLSVYGESAECAGAIVLDTAHEPCAMQRVIVAIAPGSEALVKAKGLRAPVFERGASIDEKAPALEEFMLVSAFYSGELHEERLQLRTDLKPLREQWRDMVGWEAARRGRTNASADEAKALFRPDLWAEIQNLEWHAAQLTSEIDRLERDARQVSRAYAMATQQ